MNKTMKTKILFASMVLPTLFAACTAEDLVNDQNVGTSLEGRALLDPITITVDGGTANTRFSWNEATGAWNDFGMNDMFSAGLVDGATRHDAGDDVYTNYVYKTEDGKSYTTTSQMVEGVYFFYSYPGFDKVSARGKVAFDLTTQDEIDLNNAAATVEQNQLFISPLYDLTKETAGNDLGMQFVSYWSTAAIKIANTSKQSFKIIRMAIAEKSNNKVFAVKGYVSPDKMQTAKLCYTYDEDKKAYVLPDKVEYDDIRIADIAKGTEASSAPQKVSELVVDCQEYELAAGKDVTAYLQVPAGKYTNLVLRLTIEVTEGQEILTKNVTKPLATNITESNTEKTQFRRGMTYLVFGTEGEDKTPVAYEIDEIEIITGDPVDGKYASSYEDMYEYLTEAEDTDDVTINNYGSLKLDDQLMSLINRLKCKVTFSNPIEITTERTAELNRVTFNGGATLAKGTVTLNADVKVPAGQTLTIAEGATAKIASAESGMYAGTIQNNGTLELAVAITNFADNGIKNGEKATLVISYNGFAWASAKIDMPKILNVSKDATLTLVTNKIPYTTTVNNYGTIVSGVNEGVVNNYNAITAITLQNSGEEDANEDLIIAVINNYGKITSVTFADENSTSANALVKMMSENASIATATNTGDIDNTNNGFITSAANANVYAEYSGDQDGALGNSSCTKVVIKNGNWTNASLPASVKTVEADKVVVTAATGKTIDFGNVTDLTLTGSTVQSELTVGTTSTAGVTALTLDGTEFNGKLTVNGDVSLTTLDLVGVTFNDEVTASTITNININPITTTTGTAAATTTINAVVRTGSTTAITVTDKATLNVTANGVIGNGTGTITVNEKGVVNNRGIIYGNSTVSGNGSWNGPKPVAGA